MDRIASEFAFVAESANRAIRIQTDAARRLLDNAPLGRRALSERLIAVCTTLEAHVKRRRQDFYELPDDPSRLGAVTEMKQLVHSARDLQETLSWIDAATRPPIDLGSRYFIDQILALVDSEAEITFVAADGGYSTLPNALVDGFRLDDESPRQDRRVIVVFVPRGEQRSGLLHPLIVHELGHAAVDNHHLVDKVLEHPLAPSLDDELNAAAARHANAIGEKDSAPIARGLESRLRSWIEESLCDVFAAAMLGPTFLYSFIVVAAALDLDATGPDHPPARRRIALLLDQLDRAGWAGVLKNASAPVNQWARETASMPVPAKDALAQFLIDGVSKLAEASRAVVADLVQGQAFDIATFEAVRDNLASFFKAGIPPAQDPSGKPFSRTSIVLSAWLYAIDSECEGLAVLATATDSPLLSELLPKTLELAALVEAWEEG
jgi:hypothetical protein